VLGPMVWATTKAIAPASILRTVFSAAARRLAFCNIVREVMHEHQELLRRRLTGQECNLAAVADAKEPCSFFACKITC
jgi:hypothetical protein